MNSPSDHPEAPKARLSPWYRWPGPYPVREPHIIHIQPHSVEQALIRRVVVLVLPVVTAQCDRILIAGPDETVEARRCRAQSVSGSVKVQVVPLAVAVTERKPPLAGFSTIPVTPVGSGTVTVPPGITRLRDIVAVPVTEEFSE